MIGTERALWRAMRAEVARGDKFTRIETADTATGVSDVEYVLNGNTRTGWVELKTCSPSTDLSPFTLHHPLAFSQLKWLLMHHDPSKHQVCWVLVGRLGARRWKEFWLVEPSSAVSLLEGRQKHTVAAFSAKKGVHRCASMGHVMSILTGR